MTKYSHKKTIIALFDALPYEQFRKYGYKYTININKSNIIKLESLIGYSAGLYPSIWSGLYPDQTECWSNFKYCYKKPYNITSNDKFLNFDKFLNIFQYFPLKLSQFSSLFFYLLSKKLKLFTYNYPICFDFKLKNLIVNDNNQEFLFHPEKLENNNYSTFFSKLRDNGFSFRYIFKSQFINNFSNFTENIIVYVNPVMDELGHKYGPNSKIYKKKIFQLFN